MITIRLRGPDLANVRFAFSPLWECVAAFRVWRDPARHALHLPWVTGADRRLRHTDWRRLDAVARAPSGFLPDFLAPPPPTPLARFSRELADLRRTPPSVVENETTTAYPEGVPEEVAAWLRSPETFVKALARLLDLFWRKAVAPVWPRLVARLEAEVLFRSRALALGGATALFHGLHPSVRYAGSGRGGTLRIRARDRYDRTARGAGVLLVPSVFAWPDVYVVARPPWRPTLAYPARGVADLWSSAAPVGGRGAAATLLGARRASVLAHLVTPHTTLEVAHSLRLSPAAASAQITGLWRVGVASRTRVGRRVFYALNGSGRALKEVLDQAAAAYLEEA